jgi:hypothetical protein
MISARTVRSSPRAQLGGRVVHQRQRRQPHATPQQGTAWHSRNWGARRACREETPGRETLCGGWSSILHEKAGVGMEVRYWLSCSIGCDLCVGRESTRPEPRACRFDHLRFAPRVALRLVLHNHFTPQCFAQARHGVLSGTNYWRATDPIAPLSPEYGIERRAKNKIAMNRPPRAVDYLVTEPLADRVDALLVTDPSIQ